MFLDKPCCNHRVGQRDYLPEDQGTSNTAESTKADQRGGAERPLPLPANVGGLVRHGGGHVGVGAGGDEEDAKVPDGGVRVEPHDWQADDAEGHVDEDGDAPDLVLVAEPAGAEHDEAGEGVGRGDEALGGADLEPEGLVQDDGQEVGEGVGDGGGVEEDQRVRPDLPVHAAAQEAGHGEGVDLCVAAVGVDPGDHPRALALREEAP